MGVHETCRDTACWDAAEISGTMPVGVLLKSARRVSATGYPVSSWQPSIAGNTTELPEPKRKAPSSFCSGSLY